MLEIKRKILSEAAGDYFDSGRPKIFLSLTSVSPYNLTLTVYKYLWKRVNGLANEILVQNEPKGIRL